MKVLISYKLAISLKYKNLSILGINYSSESESWSSHADMLLHVFPRHSVHATEHSRPCFLQLQRFESQFVLHLQYIVFRSSSGAGGKLDLIGTHMLSSIDHPQSFASMFSASPIHCFTWWNTCKIWKCAAFDVGGNVCTSNKFGTCHHLECKFSEE